MGMMKPQSNEFNSDFLFDHIFEETERLAKKFYFEVLTKWDPIVPSLKAKVEISRVGWEHISSKKHRRSELLFRFFALPKIIGLLQSKTITPQYELGKDKKDKVEFWILLGKVGGVKIKIVIRCINGMQKHLFSVMWKGEENQQKRAVSRLFPRCRGVVTPQLYTLYSKFLDECQEIKIKNQKSEIKIKEDFNIRPYLRNLYQPSPTSHKGQNGKLLIIGGSHLFHAASLWALKIASRMVDMVFYSSVPENNEIVAAAKSGFRDGIVVPRDDLEHYAKEADCILVGCGMNRREKPLFNCSIVPLLKDINNLPDEGEQTHQLTRYLLEHYPDKKFVLDAGSLQELDLNWLNNLKELPILTPHHEELETIARNNKTTADDILLCNAIILLKGPIDKIYSPSHDAIEISGGVAGMTKGGTGDVLAGLTAALYCKNDALTSAVLASFFNKKAGEELFEKMGNNFNASDLVEQLPKTMNAIIKSA